jgi:hypothetical protein
MFGFPSSIFFFFRFFLFLHGFFLLCSSCIFGGLLSFFVLSGLFVSVRSRARARALSLPCRLASSGLDRVRQCATYHTFEFGVFHINFVVDFDCS